MSELKNIATSYDISAGATKTFDAIVEVGKGGNVLIQAVHSFNDATAKIVPIISLDLSNWAELYKFGERVEKTLGGTTNGIALSDLPVGTLLKLKFERGSVTTGTLTVNALVS